MISRSKSIAMPTKRQSRLILNAPSRKSLYDEDVKLTMYRQAKEADIPFFNDDEPEEQSSSSSSSEGDK